MGSRISSSSENGTSTDQLERVSVSSGERCASHSASNPLIETLSFSSKPCPEPRTKPGSSGTDS